MSWSLNRTEYEPIEPGVYNVTIEDIEQVDGQYGEQLQWTFRVDADHTLRAWSSFKLSSGSKLGKWCVALLGAVPDQLEATDLVGQACAVMVSLEAHADGSEFNKVTSVMAPRKPKPKPEPVGEAEPADAMERF